MKFYRAKESQIIVTGKKSIIGSKDYCIDMPLNDMNPITYHTRVKGITARLRYLKVFKLSQAIEGEIYFKIYLNSSSGKTLFTGCLGTNEYYRTFEDILSDNIFSDRDKLLFYVSTEEASGMTIGFEAIFNTLEKFGGIE